MMERPQLASLLQLIDCVIELHLSTGFASVRDQIPSHPAMAMAHHHCGAIYRLQAQLLRLVKPKQIMHLLLGR